MAEYYIHKDSGEEKEKRSKVLTLRLHEWELTSRCSQNDFDLRCALRHGDCDVVNEVGASLARSLNICRGYFLFDQLVTTAKSIVEAANALLPRPFQIQLSDLFSLAAAHYNDPDYPMHLAGVDIFLLQRMGDQSQVLQAAANELVTRRYSHKTVINGRDVSGLPISGNNPFLIT